MQRGTSDEPFGDALRALMKQRGLSYRGLAEATREVDGKGMTHAHINMLANGHDRPSMRAMELIAHACGVRPAHFAEYRLAEAISTLPRSGSSRRLRTSVPGLVPSARPAPDHARGKYQKQSLIPPASDRVRGADRDGEQHSPRQPRHLHAAARYLRVAPDHAAEAPGEEAELVLVSQQPCG